MIGLPQTPQKLLVTVLPLSAFSAYVESFPVIFTARAGTLNCEEWPAPVRRWHCRQ